MKSKALPTKKSSPAKEKKKPEVDIFSMFGNEPVKRKERPKPAKTSAKATSGVVYLDDDDSLEHDLSLVADALEKEEMASKAADKKVSPVKKEPIVSPKSPERRKVGVKSPASPQMPKKSDKSLDSSAAAKKSKINNKTSSAKKERKAKEPKETTVEDDERKQTAIAMYHKFKNRAAVLNPGGKEIPKGTPDCLKGLQFVISGILESLERDEASALIKSCGGNCVTAISKKVTHILLGEEAGMAKTAKAEEMGIALMTEDELFNLIRKNSGQPETSKVLVVSPGKENRKFNEVKIEKQVKSQSPTKEKEKKKDVTKPVAPPQAALTVTAEPPNLDHFSFVDKYKPTSIKAIIGAGGNAQKLMNWLSNWHSNNDGTKKHTKPSPWAKNNDGSAYKAALLSGSPGVGKTTTAHLVCKELLFDIVEFNASDTRSKKMLKDEVSDLLSNKSLAGYVTGQATKVSKRHVIIMDEVDGMAGNEDRGGVAELIALIKDSRIPVICMCNDRNHPKIRSLSNHCFDLRFNKPAVSMIRGAMMSVCFKEGIKIEAAALDEIISGTNNDIRQTLNHLALYSATKDVKIETSDAKEKAQMSEKDIKMVSCSRISLESFLTSIITGTIRSYSKGILS